jgi:ketosteroid isomerase-like protein
MSRSRLAAAATLLIAGAAVAESLPPALVPIVEAERAFARRCGEVGIRQSFMEFFAEDGISFAPDPGSLQERFRARPAPREPPPILLEWGPEMAEVSADGTMGWSTGPSLLSDKTGQRPPRPGYYFSVWKKQPDGQLKVAIDVGTDTPSATPIPTVARAAGAAARAAPKDLPGSAAAVKRRDAELCKALGRGAARAYAAALTPDARLHVDGALPAVGKAAWRPLLDRLDGVMACAPQGGDATAGFGYTYGSWERRASAGGDVVEKGFYVRTWRHDRGWRVSADVRTLVPLE